MQLSSSSGPFFDDFELQNCFVCLSHASTRNSNKPKIETQKRKKNSDNFWEREEIKKTTKHKKPLRRQCAVLTLLVLTFNSRVGVVFLVSGLDPHLQVESSAAHALPWEHCYCIRPQIGYQSIATMSTNATTTYFKQFKRPLLRTTQTTTTKNHLRSYYCSYCDHFYYCICKSYELLLCYDCDCRICIAISRNE